MEQESILADIAHRLEDQRAQFIILRSTNSLDQAFLSEFLRQAYPEGRIVIDSADLLLTEGSWGALMRGVMVLSTYPLLTWGQDWTPSSLGKRGVSYRTFGFESCEGVYIAARTLFPSPRKTLVPIYNYGPPV
jgi:hypothetical protein